MILHQILLLELGTQKPIVMKKLPTIQMELAHIADINLIIQQLETPIREHTKLKVTS